MLARKTFACARFVEFEIVLRGAEELSAFQKDVALVGGLKKWLAEKTYRDFFLITWIYYAEGLRGHAVLAFQF